MSLIPILGIVVAAIVVDSMFVLWWKRRQKGLPGKTNRVTRPLFGKRIDGQTVFLQFCLLALSLLALIELVSSLFSFTLLPTVLNILVTVIVIAWLFKKHSFPLSGASHGVEPPFEEQESGTDITEENFSLQRWLQGFRAWGQTHPLEGLIAIGGGLLAIYLWRISPSTLHPGFTLQGDEGHPFHGFLFVRLFLDNVAPQLAGWVGGVGSMASLSALILAHLYSRPRAAYAGLLGTGLTFASLGQLAALDYYTTSPIRLYGMAILIFILWAQGSQQGERRELLNGKVSIPWEISLFILVFALTVLTRFYAINSFPYGIEADEGNWTAKVTATMIDGDYRNGAAFHLYTVPVGFYMQGVFFNLLGPGLVNGRIAVAVYSILGSLIFYGLIRALINPQVALLATSLLAVSLMDLSASRYSNVEVLVKLWPLLTLWLMLWGVQSQKTIAFALAGTSAALGWLTYDTVLPLLPICLLIFILEFRRQHLSWTIGLQQLATFLLPILLTFPITLAYINQRFSYYQFDKDLSDHFSFLPYLNTLGTLLNSLFVQTANDFFYNRNGPIFNSFLLPWFTLGIVIAATYWKQKRLAWIVIFFILFLLPAPILTGSPWGRVYYPGIAAAYVFMALGLLTVYQEILYIIGKVFHPLLKVVGFSALGILVVFNLYIYFNETIDNKAQQIRRELYEISLRSATDTSELFYSFLPEEDDPFDLALEGATIWLALRSSAFPETAKNGYQILSPNTLIETLQTKRLSTGTVTIVRDTTSPEATLVQANIFDDLISCYPDVKIMSESYFTLYQLSSSSLANSSCP